MDTITHAIIGATVARATAPDTTRPDVLSIKQRLVIGALAAAFPDIDYLTVFIHPLAFIAEWHRSITHSFIMLPIWAFILGYIFALLFKKQQHKKEIILICALSLFSHIIADLITSWGTQIFAPFSDYAAAWGLTFVIDPYFTAIVLLALVIALIKDSRITAQMGLVVLATYVGLQGILKSQAHSIGQDYIAQRGWHEASVYTMPQPLSPFNWKVIIIRDSQYHMALVNLLAGEPPQQPDINNTSILNLINYYQPSDQLEWKVYQQVNGQTQVIEAWNRPEFDLYRKFAVLPFLVQQNNNHTEQCTWFGDLRFVIPTINQPFRYGMCQETQPNLWSLYRLHGDGFDGRELVPVY